MTNSPYPFPDIIHVLGKMCCRKGSKRREQSSALWSITCRAAISVQKNKQLTLSFLLSYILFISFASPPPHPLILQKKEAPTLLYSFQLQICLYSSALKDLSASFFSLFHPLTLLPPSTHFMLLLYISLLFISCLLYISGLSLVVPNFSIHSLRILLISWKWELERINKMPRLNSLLLSTFKRTQQ
jgi:hypothetical protein